MMSKHVFHSPRIRPGDGSSAEAVEVRQRRRTTAVLASLASVGALLAGFSVGPIGAAAAAEPSPAHRLPPEMQTTELMGMVPVESRIMALRTLEDEAIS